MKIRYIKVKEELNSAELGSYTTFGICALEQTDSTERQVAFVSDVSTDSAFVEELAARCTAYALDPIHLLDVVMDALEQAV